MASEMISGEGGRKRLPVVFTIMCVLSLLAAGCGSMYGLALSAVADADRGEMMSAMSQTGYAVDDAMMDYVYSLAEMGPYFLLFNVIEIVGVIMLLVGQRVGFHFYAGSQIGLVGVMVIAVGWDQSFMFLLWNILWVLLYYRGVVAVFGLSKRGEEE